MKLPKINQLINIPYSLSSNLDIFSVDIVSDDRLTRWERILPNTQIGVSGWKLGALIYRVANMSNTKPLIYSREQLPVQRALCEGTGLRAVARSFRSRFLAVNYLSGHCVSRGTICPFLLRRIYNFFPK